MKERLIHIDNAKAIGMMLIIASHIIPSEPFVKSYGYEIWNSILNSFYVPLFFLLSGVFESTAVNDEKLYQRIVKLAKYICLFYVFGIVADGIVNGHWSLVSFKSQTTIWFLIVLLWITIIVGIVKRFKWHNYLYVCVVSGGVILSYKHMSLLYLGQACVCLPFYLSGFYCKGYLKKKNFDYRVFIVSFIIWLLLFLVFNRTQNLSINLIEQNILTFYLDAVAGSMVVIELCKLFNFKMLSFFGRNSIVPMMVQIPLIWSVMKFMEVSTVYMYLLVSIIVCILCGMCIPIFRGMFYKLTC